MQQGMKYQHTVSGLQFILIEFPIFPGGTGFTSDGSSRVSRVSRLIEFMSD